MLKIGYLWIVVQVDFKDLRANSVDPDGRAHYELPPMVLCCSQIQFHFQSFKS